MEKISLQINGKEFEVTTDPETPLLWVLRDQLHMTGTKYGCGKALCGACTVHLNGNSVRSCSLPVKAAKGKITTIEGVSTEQYHPIQQAWIQEQVPQCGYCQSGQIMSAIALLNRSPNPDDKAIDTGMAGNICRCGTYPRIKKAIKEAANVIRKQSSK
jgi:isoquinoline 1-oxidoreductase subunit alpha